MKFSSPFEDKQTCGCCIQSIYRQACSGYFSMKYISAILAFQNVQGTLECYSKLKEKLGLKMSL